MPEHTDRPPATALVVMAIDGDRAAFGRLYEGHVDQVYNFLYFELRDAPRAEDLTQDVFVRALRGLGGLTQPERFPAWLMRIAHNRLVDHWQSVGRDRAMFAVAKAVDGRDVLDGVPAPDAFEPLERQVLAEHMMAAAAGLTRLQREVLALRFVAGLSVVETAEAMARSESAVKNLQHHALAGLRRILSEQESA
jgi:RNA polymerase sigma-70 factor (ECF subfamily)